MSNKQHWETVFTTKEPHQVSWTQDYPATSMDYLKSLQLPRTANIIDIGGGDSRLVDALLEMGYQNIWVLDISATALQKAIKRLGEKAALVRWIVSDINDFKPETKFDFWHDRAAFHFLTVDRDILAYTALATNSINPNGHLFLGTFSNNGPKKCSGLAITQYSESSMKATFIKDFEPVKCFSENHTTPSGNIQNFQFCGFRKTS